MRNPTVAKTYRTTRDIVIPAGTVIMQPPGRSTRWGKDHEGVVALDRDHSCYLSMDVDEAIEARAIEEVLDA